GAAGPDGTRSRQSACSAFMTWSDCLMRPIGTTGLGRILGNAASILASDVVNRGTSFVLYALVARYLGAFAFGQLSLALTLFYTFQVLAAAGLKTLVVREVTRHRERTNSYLMNGVFTVAATCALSIAA